MDLLKVFLLSFFFFFIWKIWYCRQPPLLLKMCVFEDYKFANFLCLFNNTLTKIRFFVEEICLHEKSLLPSWHFNAMYLYGDINLICKKLYLNFLKENVKKTIIYIKLLLLLKFSNKQETFSNNFYCNVMSKEII